MILSWPLFTPLWKQPSFAVWLRKTKIPIIKYDSRGNERHRGKRLHFLYILQVVCAVPHHPKPSWTTYPFPVGKQTIDRTLLSICFSHSLLERVMVEWALLHGGQKKPLNVHIMLPYEPYGSIQNYVSTGREEWLITFFMKEWTDEWMIK